MLAFDTFGRWLNSIFFFFQAEDCIRGPLVTGVQTCALPIAVGSRLALVSFAPETRIVQIDADPEEIGRTHKGTLGLVGDARATLEALLEKLRAGAPARPSRKSEREALRAEIAAAM